MFAITVDQVGSRDDTDRVEDGMAAVTARIGAHAVLAPDRTAGDEFEVLVDDPGAALDVVFDLTRTGQWSVGVGIGDVEDPLPSTTRAARGPAFVCARRAVERAKQLPERVAVEVAPERRLRSSDVEPLVALAVRARARRSAEGWELADLLEAGRSRTQAAEVLGVTPQAVAKRFAAADLRADAGVREALVRLLAEADAAR